MRQKKQSNLTFSLSFFITAVGVITTSTLFALNACAASKRVKALQLRQNHIFLGNCRVLMTPQALRFDGLGKFRFTAIARSPKWRISVFRVDERLCFTQAFDEFCDQGFFSNIVLPQRDNLMLGGGAKFKQKISGFPVEQIRQNYSMLMYMKNTNVAPAQATAFLHSAYRVPTEGHIPIGFELIMTGKDWLTNVNQEGQRRALLQTESISLVSVSNAEFEIPRGLAQAKSMTRVVAGDTRKMEQTGVDTLFDRPHQ